MFFWLYCGASLASTVFVVWRLCRAEEDAKRMR